ncbi:DNA internalization-related competence protein ComEC/Rec2 [uncultured Eubacterium sp.]|uniref:DNA internalization-related competence protein ComEC/Rec2 n=1 Tax=uncultured Eubacterium sp. TaxID=165185 RepID=UPI0025CEFDF3|nr:DNA internalization-related competence protein ComEC/Rec2 [uncultured Eubacterium sp.]
MILDSKRHICLCAAALTAGILLAGEVSAIHVIPAVFLLFGCVTGLLQRGNTPRLEMRVMIVILAICSILGAARTRRYIASYAERQAVVQNLAEVEIIGIVSRKEIKSDSYLYHIRQTYLNADQTPIFLGQIIVTNEQDDIPVGAVVTVSGKAQLFSHARNDGNFDFATYYRQLNIICRVNADMIRQNVAPHFFIRETIYQLQKKMVKVYVENLNERDAGILCTLAAGSRSQLDPDTRQVYQNAGISHLLSISGLHISIIGFSLYRLLRKMRRSYLFSAAFSIVLVFCFAYMSGFGIPARRAVIMYLCMMGAQVLGRTYEAANGLALAAILLMIENPMILDQSGFLFSFTAMLSIVLYGILFQDTRWKEKKHEERKVPWKELVLQKMLFPLKSNCLFSLWLQLWLLPLTAWFYYEVPTYSFFLNLLVLPLSGWLLGGGLLAALLYPKLPYIAGWMLVGCHEILNVYEAGMKFMRILPGNLLLTGRPELWCMVVYYLFLALFCIWKCRHTDNMEIRKKVFFTGICGGLLTGTLLFHPAELPGIYMLDVGQGDGLFLTDGVGGRIWMDGGSSSESSVGTYRMLPFLKYHRVPAIDYWIVTHPDADHISGLLELLDAEYPIRHLILAKAQEKEEACQELISLAKQKGTNIQYVRTGSELHLRDMELHCLYPDVQETAADINGLCQVWELRSHDFAMLFTGDIGEAQETLLLERNLLKPVNALKVAHHGSRYSSSEKFLTRIQPEIALISSSAHNRYRHPSPDTIERLRNQKVRICCTKDMGQLSILYRKGQWVLQHYTE